MNDFDKIYEFKWADINDINKIMSFLKEEWGSETILATNKDCFCFQYQKDDKINFIVAINKVTGEIESASGFVQYSNTIIDIGPAVWLSKPNTEMPMLGVEVMKRMVQMTGCRFWGAPGANNDSTFILKRIFKKKTGTMKHFYILSNQTCYNIAVVNHVPKKMENHDVLNIKLIAIKHIDELEARFDFEYNMERIPYKDKWFFNYRYLKHPIYDYKVWLLEDDKNKKSGLMVAREVAHAGKKALKIIDYLGDIHLISGLSQAFNDLLMVSGYEFIDIYCVGIPDEIMNKAGFVLREEKDTNIIPNYFEPFLQENIEIQYNSNIETALFFRGDSDRDRPYIWEKEGKK